MNDKQIYEATRQLSGTLRKARQSQWATELDEALGEGDVNNQKLGEIITVLRRLDRTSLPGVLGLSDTVSNLITEIDRFFKAKR